MIAFARSALAVVVLVLGVSPLVVAPAGAADPVPSRSTWSVQPATADGGLDTRSSFTLTGVPGRTHIDRVAVSNHSDKPLRFTLAATDAFNTEAGDFSLLPASVQPTDVGAWVRLKSRSLAVPARSRASVPFSLTVPANASPGDHVGGIVASLVSSETEGDTGRVALDQRVGTRIYLRVPGEVRADLAITQLSTRYDAATNPVGRGVATVRYTVHNAGNVRMSARQELVVKGSFGLGAVDATVGALPELLPGESATYTQEVRIVALGRVTGTLTLHSYVAGSPDQEQAPVTRSASTAAVSWSALAAVLLLVLLGLGVAALMRVQRRRRAAQIARAVEAARAADLAAAQGPAVSG